MKNWIVIFVCLCLVNTITCFQPCGVVTGHILNPESSNLTVQPNSLLGILIQKYMDDDDNKETGNSKYKIRFRRNYIPSRHYEFSPAILQDLNFNFSKASTLFCRAVYNRYFLDVVIQLDYYNFLFRYTPF